MANESVIGKKSVGIAKGLVVDSTKFLKGVATSTTSTASSTIKRTAAKIKDTSRRINYENKKQENQEKQVEEYLRRKGREDLIEAKGKSTFSPIKSVVNNAIKKPLMSLWSLIQAWLIDNGPELIAELRKFTKKVRIIGALTKRAFRSAIKVFSSIGDIASAFIKNMVAFDFTDKSGNIKKAREDLDRNMEDVKSSVSLMGDVWEKEEEELDQILARFTSESEVDRYANEILADVEALTPLLDVKPGQAQSGSDPGSASTGVFDLIASGEGDYNSVNRGNAGDTPGGAKSLFGKDLTEMKVGEIMSAQQSGDVFAVGRYQIIPSTMVDFVKNSDVKPTDKFDEKTQEKFKDYVINVKRPEVGRYLRGESDDRTAAAQGLAREFASVGAARAETISGFAPAQRGDTLYGGKGNNRASIDPAEIEGALDRDRAATLSRPAQPAGGNIEPASPNRGNANPGSLANAAQALKASRFDTSRYGRDGCVYAVNEVYKRAGLTPPWGSSVYVPTARKYLIRAGYKMVSPNNALPGDIVIMLDRHPTEPWVHIGVVGSNGTVLHNSSNNQAFTNEETFAQLSKRYVKIEVFRMPNKVSANKTSIQGKSAEIASVNSERISSKKTGGTQKQTSVQILRQTTIVA